MWLTNEKNDAIRILNISPIITCLALLSLILLIQQTLSFVAFLLSDNIFTLFSELNPKLIAALFLFLLPFVGLFFCLYFAPIFIITIKETEKILSISKFGITGFKQRSIGFDSLASEILTETETLEGTTYYKLYVKLNSEEKVYLGDNSSSNKMLNIRAKESANAYLKSRTRELEKEKSDEFKLTMMEDDW